jgi:Protein of unknown function (DUF2917)
MTTTTMQESNQLPDVAWALPERGAVTLLADRAQVLWVHAGRVWLTRRCERGHADDVWLDAGQRWLLPAGSEWVAEAAPNASVSLVLAPQPAALSRPAVSASAWQRARRSWALAWPRAARALAHAA